MNSPRDRQAKADREGLLLAAQVDRSFGAGQATRPATVLVAGVVSAGMEGFLLWETVGAARIVPWVAMVFAVHLGGLLLGLLFRRKMRPGMEQVGRWARYKLIQRTLMGLAWGLSVPMMYVPGITETLMVPVMVIVALTSASITLHADYLPSLNALLSSCLLPAAGFLLLIPGGGQTESFVGIALLILLGVLISAGRSVTRTIADALLVRIDLAAALAQERSQRVETERARAEAEVAKEQTTRFFSAVSHDLRQPAHALGLYMSLLRKNPAEPKRKELIKNIASCVDNLESLFNALLDVSEASEASSKLSLTAVPLSKLIAQAIVQFTPEARRKGLDLRAAQTSLWVRTDETSLGRIIGNLVSNAIRYTESGRVLIGVRRRGKGCELVVADTGIGIAPEDQARVFADFYQVNNPGRDRNLGLGLGLATVCRLCERLGYVINLQSIPGRGSRFAVGLECIPAPIDSASPQEPAAHLPDLHVLLVEDDALGRDAMETMLAGWNLPVRSCATGDEALAILQASAHYRWHVLLDYRLAGSETGLDIANRIRASCRPLPVMSLITGETDPAVLESAKRLGLVVVSKPVKPIRLRSLLASQAIAATQAN